MGLPKDRVVLVTGGSRGIGLATARAFRRDGARVAVLSREGREMSDLLSLRSDVRKPEAVRDAVRAVVDTFGALHVVINNAGVGHFARVRDLRTADVQEVFATNVYGVLNVIQETLPYLKGGKAQIINVSSILARSVLPLSAAYVMSKHALHALTATLRIEMRHEGIEVIEVGPGATATDFALQAGVRGLGGPPAFNSGARSSPERVARAILAASRKGTREVWLTATGRAFIRAQGSFPRFVDFFLGHRLRKVLTDNGRLNH
jgi:NAD(P)-dependent dehydrogenase (short-subunit alcohol dehydrogenase family)